MSRLQELFAELMADEPMELVGVYTDDVTFQDPFHRIEGRASLKEYFERLNENVDSCTFEFHDVVESGNAGVVTWTMRLRTKRGPKGTVVLDGATHVTYRDGLIATHRDYFDAGQMVYEHVPLLGSAIRAIKKRI